MKKSELKSLINEVIEESKSSNQLVVIDVQPEYYDNVEDILPGFIQYINEYTGPILYVYNGPELGMCEEHELIDWLIEHGLDEDKIDDIEFKDKE